MNFRGFCLLFFLSFFWLLRAKAQVAEHTAWMGWWHTQQLNQHWALSFDMQLRTADKLDYIRTPVFRPSVKYTFNKLLSASTGYTIIDTRRRSPDGNANKFEQRIFEQLNFSESWRHNINLQQRIRLEQRFVHRVGNADPYFAQRLRFYLRGTIPIAANSTFTKGVYLALQNEYFANVYNNDKINGSLFDQNRAYAALGYRLNKKADIEAGYLDQYQKFAGSTSANNNVIQLALFTRFGSL